MLQSMGLQRVGHDLATEEQEHRILILQSIITKSLVQSTIQVGNKNNQDKMLVNHVVYTFVFKT